MGSSIKQRIFNLLSKEFSVFFNFPFDKRKAGVRIGFSNSGVFGVRNVLFTVFVFTPFDGRNGEAEHVLFHDRVRDVLVNCHLDVDNDEVLGSNVVIGFPFDENDSPTLVSENFYVTSMSFNVVDNY